MEPEYFLQLVYLLKGVMQLADLVKDVTQNTQAIYNRLTKMYQFEIKATGDIDRAVPTLQVKTCPSDLLNRATWLWLRSTLTELQRQVNLVVDLYNYANYIDMTSFSYTPAIELAIPESLVIDMSVLDKEFKRINNLLDQLDGYALVVEKGRK